jgi:hypothetical protein
MDQQKNNTNDTEAVQRQRIARLEAELQQAELESSRKSAVIGSRNGRIDELMRMRREKQATITELREARRAQKERIDELMQMRRDKQATIDELREARRAQKGRIDELMQMRREKQATITELREARRAQKKRIATLDAELAATRAALVEKDAAIAALQDSVSWRATKPLRAITRPFKSGHQATAETPDDTRTEPHAPSGPMPEPDPESAVATQPEMQEPELESVVTPQPASQPEFAPVPAPKAGPTPEEPESEPEVGPELKPEPESEPEDPSAPTFDKNGAPLYPSLEAIQGLDFEPYSSSYQEDIDFSGKEPPVKALAFYLPQFHAIPENDAWWGEGFTEWTNTCKAESLYQGHYEPREPHDDIGYYDLSDVETIKKQAALARRHGIHGFCLYYYWFSGKKLLEKPLELILAHPEIDINFCLCWANENWTRRWDGQENDILIAQEYAEDDPERFIDSIQDALRDPRYIRSEGRPVILIYNPRSARDLGTLVKRWRTRAHDLGIGPIQVWMCQSFGMPADSLEDGLYFDGEVEFPPHSTHPPDGSTGITIEDARCNVVPYEEMVRAKVQDMQEGAPRSSLFDIPQYRTVTMAWDNTPRKKTAWRSLCGFSLELFHRWASETVKNAQRNNQDFIFVNAWNEWGEGVYLEPDKRYGYATINTFSGALFGKRFEDEE